jgi:hypothetical protein
MIPHRSQKPSAESNPSFGVEFPDFHPIKVLFVNDILPEGFIFLPVTTAPSLNM